MTARTAIVHTDHGTYTGRLDWWDGERASIDGQIVEGVRAVIW